LAATFPIVRSREILSRWFPGVPMHGSMTEIAWVSFGEDGDWFEGVSFSPEFDRYLNVVALLDSHRRADGAECEPLTIRFEPDPERNVLPVYHIDEDDPLTISPPIRCSYCDHVGKIEEGRWVTM
jgi:hypothetical protein